VRLKIIAGLEFGNRKSIWYYLFMDVVTKTIEETKKVAEKFLAELLSRKDEATLVALSGDLGSGKTTFVQQCAKIFGIESKVTSPTFVIMKKYPIPEFSKRSNLNALRFFVHIDAYRLKSGEELLKLNWQELISDPQNLIFIEWPENVMSVMTQNALQISFKSLDETKRRIVL